MYNAIPLSAFTEPLSCFTHLLGGMIFLYLSFDLRSRAKSIPSSTTGVQVALLSFSLSCVFLLFMSSIFHFAPHGGEFRAVLQRLDHAGIFLFIAGTITAVEFLLFEGVKRAVVITGTWVLAIVGVILKVIFFHEISPTLGACLYLGFGWIGVISAASLCGKHSFSFLKPLFFGAAAYTLGACCDTFGEPILITGVFGPHELFHVLVIFGMAAHWKFVLQSLPIYDRRMREINASNFPANA